MRTRLSAAAIAAALAVIPARADEPPPLQTVSKVDLNRYLGVWHELARYENSFQGPACVNVTAEYTLDEDGDIGVLNTCRNEAGEITDQADGTAYVADKATGAKLRVSFFWPIYGNYWIVALADDYSWVIVSEPGRDYLWLLTRARHPGKDVADAMVARAAALGFDTSRLYFSQRPAG